MERGEVLTATRRIRQRESLTAITTNTAAKYRRRSKLQDALPCCDLEGETSQMTRPRQGGTQCVESGAGTLVCRGRLPRTAARVANPCPARHRASLFQRRVRRVAARDLVFPTKHPPSRLCSLRFKNSGAQTRGGKFLKIPVTSRPRAAVFNRHGGVLGIRHQFAFSLDAFAKPSNPLPMILARKKNAAIRKIPKRIHDR